MHEVAQSRQRISNRARDCFPDLAQPCSVDPACCLPSSAKLVEEQSLIWWVCVNSCCQLVLQQNSYQSCKPGALQRGLASNCTTRNRPKSPNESIQKNMLLQCRLNPLHDLRPLRYLLAFSFSTICRSSISYLLSYICTKKGIRSCCRRTTMLQCLGRLSNTGAHIMSDFPTQAWLSEVAAARSHLHFCGAAPLLKNILRATEGELFLRRHHATVRAIFAMQQHSAGRRPALCKGVNRVLRSQRQHFRR